MPEPDYTQIQTYMTCDPTTWNYVLRRYWLALAQLGCTDTRVREWLASIPWPQDDEDGFGDIFAAPLALQPPHQATILCAGIEVSLYAQPGIPTIEEPPAWLGLNLLIDPDRLRAQATEPYKPGVGGSLWSILLTLANEFGELGAYFTDPWQENAAWRAIVEESGDPWAFELAIFPRSLSNHFQEVPAGYQGIVLDGSFGFALANRWNMMPWDETEQNTQKK